MGLKKGHTAKYKFVGAAIILAVIVFTSCQAEPTDTIPTTAKTYTGLPLVLFETNDFTGSGNCAICHTQLTDSAGNNISIDSHWRSTIMANASKDLFWQAKVASEVVRNPGLKEVIEDKCASCHMPMAYTQAEVDGLSTLVLDEGFLNSNNALNKAAMDGNSCTLCHQIIDPVLGEYHIDTSTEPPERLIYGQFEDPLQETMMQIVGFKPIAGEQISQSVLCGTCH